MTGFRLVEGLGLVTTADGVVVEGGPRRLRFTDRVSTGLLADRALLDRTADPAALAAATGLAPDEIAAAAGALVEHGVLTDEPPAGDEMAIYLGRMLPGPPGAEARRRLAAAQVRVDGTGWVADLIADLLDGSGLGAVRRGDADGSAPPDLVVAVDVPAPSGQDCLPVATAEPAVGPIVGPGGDRCPLCCRPESCEAPADPAAALMVAGLAAAAAVAFLGRHLPCTAYGQRLEVDPARRSVETAAVGCRPDCPACGGTPLPDENGALRALEAEQAAETVRGGPDRVVPGRGHSSREKVYLDLPRRSLTTRGQGPLAALLPLLAAVVPAGRRGGRAVPSVGGAGSIATFVLPTGSADPLRAGGYVQPSTRELVLLRPEDALGTQPVRSARLALVGNLAGATGLYGAAGRRIMLQDAGYLLGRLVDAADTLGLPWSVRTDWTAAGIAEELELAHFDAPVAVLEVALPAVPDRTVGAAVSVTYEFRPGGVDPQAVLGPVLARTGGLADGLSTLPYRSGDPGRLSAYLADRGVQLPAAVLVAADLRPILAERGADGWQSAVVRAAALAYLVAAAAERQGVASGLLARLPSTALSTRPSAVDGGPRLLAGVGLGTGRTGDRRRHESAVMW
jgi:hypothetical protein